MVSTTDQRCLSAVEVAWPHALLPLARYRMTGPAWIGQRLRIMRVGAQQGGLLLQLRHIEESLKHTTLRIIS